MCTKAIAARLSLGGPQTESISLVSCSIQAATESSTQSGTCVEFSPAVLPAKGIFETSQYLLRYTPAPGTVASKSKRCVPRESNAQSINAGTKSIHFIYQSLNLLCNLRIHYRIQTHQTHERRPVKKHVVSLHSRRSGYGGGIV